MVEVVYEVLGFDIVCFVIEEGLDVGDVFGFDDLMEGVVF